MKLPNFYKLELVGLEGNYAYWGENITDFSKPARELQIDNPSDLFSEILVGFFYVDTDKIYYISKYYEDDMEVLRDSESFPWSPETLKNYYNELKAKGEHSGYIGWELVCSENGLEDTMGTKGNPDAYIDRAAGIIREERYHNFITVDGDERRYNAYPEDNRTTGYTYITWKEGQGITDYADWVGNQKDMIWFKVL